MTPLPRLAAVAAARLKSHHDIVLACQALQPVHRAVSVSRDKAVSSISELVARVKETRSWATSETLTAIAARVDALSVGALDAAMIEVLAELMDTVSQQLELEEQMAEMGRTGT